MFTGIVEKTVKVISFHNGRLTLAADWADVKHGESIAISGVCLTVADISSGQLAFDVIKETLDKTNLGALKTGDAVNVERSLRVGDRIDGHFVQGHVDGTGELIDQVKNDVEVRLTIKAPDHLAKFLAPKGSISIDGVSLTIAAVRGNIFEVALIPTTLQLTTLGSRKIGWRFNLEADILSKTIVNYMEQRK